MYGVERGRLERRYEVKRRSLISPAAALLVRWRRTRKAHTNGLTGAAPPFCPPNCIYRAAWRLGDDPTAGARGRGGAGVPAAGQLGPADGQWASLGRRGCAGEALNSRTGMPAAHAHLEAWPLRGGSPLRRRGGRMDSMHGVDAWMLHG